MATWNISPSDVSISSSGVVNFPANTTTSDKVYTITYTDNDGCTGNLVYTVPKASCYLKVLGPADGIYLVTITSCTASQMVSIQSYGSSVSDPRTPTVTINGGSSQYFSVGTPTLTIPQAAIYSVEISIFKSPSSTMTQQFTVTNNCGRSETFSIRLTPNVSSCTGPTVPATQTVWGCSSSTYYPVTLGSCDATITAVTSSENWVTGRTYEASDGVVRLNFSNTFTSVSNATDTRSATITVTDCLGKTASTVITQAQEWLWQTNLQAVLSSPNMQPNENVTPSVLNCRFLMCNYQMISQSDRQTLANAITNGFSITWSYKYCTNLTCTATATTSFTETVSANQVKDLILNTTAVGGNSLQITLSNNGTHHLPNFYSTNTCWCVNVTVGGYPIQLMRTGWSSGYLSGSCGRISPCN